MSVKSKNFTLYLISILVASCVLLAVEPCVAPELTKPDKPIFTIEYPEIIDFASDGLNLNITNQPFTPYTDDDGFEINLYYEAQIRKQGWVDTPWTPVINTRPYIEQSNLQYTIIALPISQNLDVRVRALVGTVIQHPSTAESPAPVPFEFKGVEGDWSDIQPVILNWTTFSPTSSLPSSTSPVNTNPSTPNPSSKYIGTPITTPWLSLGIVLGTWIVLVVLIIVSAVLLLRRGTKT
ncbi:MAG: hypothetical protein LBH62_06685 [Nitrososphaerota archaeon]|jgi:hypothetical protein|nr:hypothetical protein [Nitrososphaerota archaeon]